MRKIHLLLFSIMFTCSWGQEVRIAQNSSDQISEVRKNKTTRPLKALDQIQEILSSESGKSNAKLRAEALMEYSDIVKDQGDLVESIDSLNKALNLLRNISPSPFERISGAYLILGNIYISESAYYERNEMFALADSSAVQASVNYNKALFYADSANCLVCKAKALLNLGICAVKLFKDEEARAFYDEALALALNEKDTNLIALVWLNKGNLINYQDDREGAQSLYIKARDFFKGSSDFKNWINTNINLAHLSNWSKSGNSLQLLLEADSLSRANNLKSQQGLIQEFLYKIYRDRGNHQQALGHLEKYRAIQDSMLTSSFKDKELRVRYETAKKQEMYERERAQKLEKELALSQAEQQSKTYKTWSIIGASLSILLIAFLGWRNRTQKIISHQEDRIHHQQLLELEQIQKIESANALLKGQDKERIRIAEEIHDKLGGTLVAARMWSELASAPLPESNENMDRTKKLLDQAIEDARTIAHHLLPGSLIKFGLKSALNDLIDSFNFPNGPTINAQLTKIENLDPQQEFQLYRIAQEVFNNAIKHSEAGSINISLLQNEKNQVILSISDNGKGFNPQEVEQGIGLKTINSRANSLSASVEMKSSPGEGTQYTVTLNSVSNEKNKHRIS